ncbi:MAG: serine hydrolase [Myxococcales bacterium]|nr:serine hydrolase [Myxococcales bacterium]
MRVIAAVAMLGCTPSPASWDGPILSEPRTQLTVEQLQGGQVPPLLDMSFLARPVWALGEPASFEGALAVGGSALEMDFPRTRDRYAGEGRFPALTIELLSHDGQLLPVRRGVLDTSQGDSLWDVIVGTGAVWREAGDEAWSRASFPLALVDRAFNQVRNCVATFVYQVDAVSPVYLQCSQETADLADEQLGNIQALVEATYAAADVPDAVAVIDEHARTTTMRLPTRPLHEWDVDGEVADTFEASLWTNASTSIGAVYADGTLHVHAPMTRHGPYPYPSEMRHGVYSVTKSLAGALSMFYFAERYGEDLFDARITEYVPAFADLPEWQGVTFSHALNMATGTHGGEEGHLLYEPLVLADTAEQAIRNIAALGDSSAAPGERFSYATTHPFVLSYALQRYVEAQEESGVRYWDLVRDNVLAPIGAEGMALLWTREEDQSERIPLLGFGARPTVDEAAKVALLLSNEGRHEGETLLHAGKIREALGRSSWDGFEIDRNTRYRHSFWSRSVRVGGCRVEASTMQGYGGNHVALLDSGVIVLRFMDEFDEDIEGLIRRVERVVSSCKGR